jgi:hypothetical protein
MIFPDLTPKEVLPSCLTALLPESFDGRYPVATGTALLAD